MTDDFNILDVATWDGGTVAVLPLSHVLGTELIDKLRADYARLAESAIGVVELDLLSVRYIDDWFFRGLLELRRGLERRSIPLRLRVAPTIREVLAITKLDRILTIV